MTSYKPSKANEAQPQNLCFYENLIYQNIGPDANSYKFQDASTRASNFQSRNDNKDTTRGPTYVPNVTPKVVC